MTVQKQTYKQGEDGRLYFTYNLGAEYEIRPPDGEAFIIRIIECGFDADTEVEYYRIESAGKELPMRYSVKQLEFLLRQLPFKEINAGELIEIPLLREEVRAYFAAKLTELKKANVQENEKLKGTAYNSNLKAIKNISERLRYYKSSGDLIRAKELEEALKKVEAEQATLLDEKKVDERILRKVPDCSECCDTGILNGGICACAYEIADKIKAYNAEKRLAF